MAVAAHIRVMVFLPLARSAAALAPLDGTPLAAITQPAVPPPITTTDIKMTKILELRGNDIKSSTKSGLFSSHQDFGGSYVIYRTILI